MRKYILITLLLAFNAAFSQNDLKARLEFEQAESAFSQSNYKEAYTRLTNAQELVGKWVPNISYLKIKCLDKLCNYADGSNEYTLALALEVKKYMSFAESNKEAVVIDKFKEVYEVEEKFKNAANQQRLTSDPEFLLAEKSDHEKNYLVAIENYKKAAEKGNAIAMRKIGNYYENGKYVQRNTETAIVWYNKAIEKGNIDALVDLGKMKMGSGTPVLAGLGTLLRLGTVTTAVTSPSAPTGNLLEAKRLFTMAAEKGSSDALVYLGYAEFLSNNPNAAIAFYKAAAEKGNGAGYTKMGVAYSTGDRVAKNDETATIWFHKAKELNDYEAFFHYANNIADNVKSKPKSVRPGLTAQAKENYIKYLELTNSQGNFAANAQLFLGELFLEEGNNTEAFKYFKAAADAGKNLACTQVSAMYKKGSGVEKNAELAKEYAEKAKNIQTAAMGNLFGK